MQYLNMEGQAVGVALTTWVAPGLDHLGGTWFSTWFSTWFRATPWPSRYSVALGPSWLACRPGARAIARLCGGQERWRKEDKHRGQLLIDHAATLAGTGEGAATGG